MWQIIIQLLVVKSSPEKVSNNFLRKSVNVIIKINKKKNTVVDIITVLFTLLILLCFSAPGAHGRPGTGQCCRGT